MIIKIFWNIVFLVFLQSSAVPVKKNPVPLWKDDYHVEIKELLTIGSDREDATDFLFSAVNDIRIDNRNRVYVLDRKESVIKIFDENGVFIEEIHLKRGQGPGEFIRPAFFDLSENRLYVSDEGGDRLTILDWEGRYVTSMRTDFHPGRIAVGKGSRIFVDSGFLSKDKDEFRSIDTARKTEEFAFCRETEESRLFRRVGGTGELCTDNEGNVYISSHIPYLIRKYNPDGVLLCEFSREMEIKKIITGRDSGLPDTNIWTSGITVLPDGKVLNVFAWRVEDRMERAFDIFSAEGDWLLTFADTDLPGKTSFRRLVKADHKGNLYMEYWAPYPHIKKYSLKILKNEKGSP